MCPSPVTSVGIRPPPPPGVEDDLDVAALHPDGPGELRRRHRALDGLDPRRPAEGRQLGAGPARGPGGQLRQAARNRLREPPIVVSSPSMSLRTLI